MGKKKSSFHMGDEFNGSGKKVYLRATKHNTYPPLSQENIRLTPDFSQYTLCAVGAMPVINAGAKGSVAALKALGSIPCVGQVIIQKDGKTGKYRTKFIVRRIQLTTGAYLHSSKRKNEKKEEKKKFIMDTIGNCIKR